MFPILFHLPAWLPLLGGQPITSFGVMMFAAFLVGGALSRSEMDRKGMEGDRAWDLLLWAVLGGILGAKIYYLLLNFPLVLQDPGFIFSRGGLVWYGGFLLAAVLVLWQVRRIGLPVGATADSVAPALAIAYAVGRVGCFLVGDDYGRPTGSWVGIRFPQGAPPSRVDIMERLFGTTVDPSLVEKYGQVVPVHPTQLYEVGMSTLIFLILWKLRGHRHGAGWLFMVWLALAGVERFVVEIFRAKDDRLLGPFTIAQMISLGLVVAGLIGVSRLSAGRAVAAADVD